MAATSGVIARLRDHDASGCRRPLFVCRSWAGPGATSIVARGARLRAARFGSTRGRRSSAGAWKRDSSKERVEGTPRRNGGSGAVVLSCCRAVVRLLDCAIAWSGVRVGVRSRVRVFVCSCGGTAAFVPNDHLIARRAASGEWRVASGERRAVKGEWRRAKGERAPSGHGARRAKSACARPCGAGSHGFTAHARGATACRFRRYRPSPTMPTSDTNASSEKNSASGSHSPR